jgi:hypothetical protein
LRRRMDAMMHSNLIDGPQPAPSLNDFRRFSLSHGRGMCHAIMTA